MIWPLERNGFWFGSRWYSSYLIPVVDPPESAHPGSVPGLLTAVLRYCRTHTRVHTRTNIASRSISQGKLVQTLLLESICESCVPLGFMGIEQQEQPTSICVQPHLSICWLPGMIHTALLYQ